MRFEWMPGNSGHVLRHAPLSVAVQVMEADDFLELETSIDGHTVAACGTANGKMHFIVFQRTRYEAEKTIYVVTCYKMSRKQRKRRGV